MKSLSRLYWFTRYYKLFRLAMTSPMKNDILYDTFIAASQYFHNNKNRRNEIAPNNVRYILFCSGFAAYFKWYIGTSYI